MAKILVGIVTFGNLDFTKLTIESIKQTSDYDLDFFVIVGKPNDIETAEWLNQQKNVLYTVHDKNYGFPYSINDIYDHAWKYNNYDYLILAGNDIYCYPHAINSLISLANLSDYDCINGLQYDVKSLITQFPETRQYFSGENLIFLDFDKRPMDLFKDYAPKLSISHMQLLDIQNLCLYKRNVFNQIGYTDVNFFPAYFVDNDYARRMVNAGTKCCVLQNARFFHFWSRTIKQEVGGSTGNQFDANRRYYSHKWGGDFGQETINAPIKIDTRDNEESMIDQWR